MNNIAFRNAHLNCFAFIAIFATLAFIGTARAQDASKSRKPKLLVLTSDPEDPQAKALAECERLTIEAYRERGNEVRPISNPDFKKWLDAAGKDVMDANPNFQYIALAKQYKADAIGGITYMNIKPEDAGNMPFAPGVYYNAWGISLSGCSRNSGFDPGEPGAIAARPLHLTKDDPWGVPLKIEPKPCSPGEQSMTMMGSPEAAKGRPFLGVQLNDRKVSRIVPGTPAESAGIKVDDELVTFNGKPITNLGDLAGAMQELKAGDEVDLEYTHDGASVKKRVKLADHFEAVESKQDRVGKPLPDLAGKDINGKPVRLSDLRGKVVLLDFWATWCMPCIEEMPLLQLLSEATKGKDFVWLSVSVDQDEDAWKQFIRANKPGGIQMHNPDWADAMFVSGFPTILLVDRDGIIRCMPRGGATAQSVMAMLEKK